MRKKRDTSLYARMLERMCENEELAEAAGLADAPSEPWSVYILRCADGSLYTGIAKDLDRRVAQHNAGQGARYTRSRLPVAVVYRESSPSRAQALRREHAIKRLGRAGKEKLVQRGDP